MVRVWKIRAGAKKPRPVSDGMVLQDRSIRGLLDLSICVATSSESSALLETVVTAAASEAIRKDTGIISWVHWPSSITIDGRVVGETSLSQPPDGRAVVMRVTVNCFAPLGDVTFSAGLPSTSILEALGVEVDMDLLRERTLDSIDWYCAEWERGEYQKLVRRIQPTVAWIGQRVRVKTSQGMVVAGTAMGLDEAGSLLIDTGEETTPVALSSQDVDLVLPVRQSTQPRAAKRTLL